MEQADLRDCLGGSEAAGAFEACAKSPVTVSERLGELRQRVGPIGSTPHVRVLRTAFVSLTGIVGELAAVTVSPVRLDEIDGELTDLLRRVGALEERKSVTREFVSRLFGDLAGSFQAAHDADVLRLEQAIGDLAERLEAVTVSQSKEETSV